MPSHTTDRDFGWKKFTEEYVKTDGAHVKMGFQGARASARKSKHAEKYAASVQLSESLTVVQVAAYHEFGGQNGRPPKRSFLRSTFDRTRTARNAFVVELLEKISVGKMTIDRALGLMGLMGVRDIKTTIQKSIGIKPLAQSTIDRKGSSRPLIDTGQMINSLSFAKVVEGREST